MIEAMLSIKEKLEWARKRQVPPGADPNLWPHSPEGWARLEKGLLFSEELGRSLVNNLNAAALSEREAEGCRAALFQPAPATTPRSASSNAATAPKAQSSVEPVAAAAAGDQPGAGTNGSARDGGPAGGVTVDPSEASRQRVERIVFLARQKRLRANAERELRGRDDLPVT